MDFEYRFGCNREWTSFLCVCWHHSCQQPMCVCNVVLMCDAPSQHLVRALELIGVIHSSALIFPKDCICKHYKGKPVYCCPDHNLVRVYSGLSAYILWKKLLPIPYYIWIYKYMFMCAQTHMPDADKQCHVLPTINRTLETYYTGTSKCVCGS